MVILPHIQVFHFIIYYWGTLFSGIQPCSDMICEFFNDKTLSALSNMYKESIVQNNKTLANNVTTVSLYNIHYLYQVHRKHEPDHCELPTDLTMAESEESFVRFGFLFNASFGNFDGIQYTQLPLKFSYEY